MDELLEAVKILILKSTEAAEKFDSGEAMKLSQAALNTSHVISTLYNCGAFVSKQPE